MTKWLCVLAIFAIAVAMVLVWPGAIRAGSPVVHAILFWSRTCPHCHYVMEEVLPLLQAQ